MQYLCYNLTDGLNRMFKDNNPMVVKICFILFRQFIIFNEANEMALIQKFFDHILDVKPHIFVTYNGKYMCLFHVMFYQSLYISFLCNNINKVTQGINLVFQNLIMKKL